MKGDIKSIMIVTKARDNHLIKLTRELSLYLMNREQAGKERGLIVYVLSSLRCPVITCPVISSSVVESVLRLNS